MRSPWPARITALLVTAAVLGPLFVAGGVALRSDMVFVPDQPWKSAWLGLDGSTPRAVPMDALVALVDEVVPGALLQRLLLVTAFVAGGIGIARLARPRSALAEVVAVVVLLWNPWVHERLMIGQWPMVLAYGLLPWVVLAAERLREGEPGARSRLLLLLLGVAVCAPSAGLLGAVLAAAVAGRRRVLEVGGLSLLVNLPWIVPALTGPSLRGSGDQFGEFAARGESALGTAASLLSMGGIWKTSAVPPERTHAVVVAAAVVLSLVCLAGYRYAVPALGRTARPVAAVGAAAFLVALLPAVGPVGDLLGSVSEQVPALGILRDSQRYLAPLGLVLALGGAALADRLRTGPARERFSALAPLLVVTPLVLLPSLVWGLAGGLRPVDYPADWERVAAKVGAGRGATVVLPWTGSYRGYAWNARRAVLDPAQRYLPGDVLVDDRVYLRGTVVPGEDPFLRRVGDALGSRDAAAGLRGLGVRWVLVEKGNGVTADQVPTGTSVHDGRWLRLVDLGAPSRTVAAVRDAPPAWPVLLADGIVLFAACISFWQRTRHYARVRPSLV